MVEEQNDQDTYKIEITEQSYKINNKSYNHVLVDKIKSERLANFDHCPHAKNDKIQIACEICQEEKEVFRQLEILPEPSYNVAETTIESDLTQTQQ